MDDNVVWFTPETQKEKEQAIEQSRRRIVCMHKTDIDMDRFRQTGEEYHNTCFFVVDPAPESPNREELLAQNAELQATLQQMLLDELPQELREGGDGV